MEKEQLNTITKRIDHLSHISKKYLTEIPPFPSSVKIELTARCNYGCGFCAVSKRNGNIKPKDMDFDFFKKITMEMRELGVKEIGLFYIGESFMNPKLLVNSIQYLKSKLKIPYVFLTSNASLANPVVVERCMREGLDSLKWSVNFADNEQFASMTKAHSSCFSQSLSNILNAHKIREKFSYKTKLYASSILFDEEQKIKMQSLLNTFVLKYVDEHYWLPLLNHGLVFSDGRAAVGNPGRIGGLVNGVPCWAIFTAGHVMADGKVTACCFDGYGDWVMGDLKQQTFMEAWHSEEFQKLRRAHLSNDITKTKCEKCALLPE